MALALNIIKNRITGRAGGAQPVIPPDLYSDLHVYEHYINLGYRS